jgi:gas vesicle protein
MNTRVGWALLVGFGLGAVTGLLLAPQSGEQSRRWITKKTREGVRQASRAVEDAANKTSAAIDEGRERIADAVEATRKVYAKAAGVLG